MFSNEVCSKLENIIHGTVIEEQSDTCTKIRNNLCSSFSTSRTVKEDFEGKSVIKKEQERFLQELATKYGYWVEELPNAVFYLARGGEAKVYLDADGMNVVKLMMEYTTQHGLSILIAL